MHECARPGLEPPRRQEREGLLIFSSPLRPLRLCGSDLRNRQDAKSAKVFLLFLLSFAAFAPSRFKPRNRQSGPSTNLNRHRPRREPPRFSSLAVSRGSVRFPGRSHCTPKGRGMQGPDPVTCATPCGAGRMRLPGQTQVRNGTCVRHANTRASVAPTGWMWYNAGQLQVWRARCRLERVFGPRHGSAPGGS